MVDVPSQSTENPMGEVHAELILKNVFNGQSAVVRALVDTGATEMIVTAGVATALGFDLEGMSRQFVTLADGRRIEVPRIGPLEIQFDGRTMFFEAMVLGDECLMGQIPLEGLDLIIDPKARRLVGKHGAVAVYRV